MRRREDSPWSALVGLRPIKPVAGLQRACVAKVIVWGRLHGSRLGRARAVVAGDPEADDQKCDAAIEHGDTNQALLKDNAVGWCQRVFEGFAHHQCLRLPQGRPVIGARAVNTFAKRKASFRRRQLIYRTFNRSDVSAS
jgi:hypothetical protein